MYLLNLSGSEHNDPMVYYLHSTMYLLNLFPDTQLEYQIHNLHSTMYLLNRSDKANAIGIALIYIPLCIY